MDECQFYFVLISTFEVRYILLLTKHHTLVYQKDLQNGNDLVFWSDFLQNYAENHATQVHIGLGWALGQERLSTDEYLDKLQPLLSWRILDGYGYYDGFFRRRKVLQGLLPEGVVGQAVNVYTQGVGRSLWYTSKGSISKLLKMIEMLPQERHADLWRGIGIASTYVGGLDTELSHKLWEVAGSYQNRLAAGAALAIKSRVAAKTIAEEDKNHRNEWCQLTIFQLVSLLKQMEPPLNVDSRDTYHLWITNIDEVFK